MLLSKGVGVRRPGLLFVALSIALMVRRSPRGRQRRGAVVGRISEMRANLERLSLNGAVYALNTDAKGVLYGRSFHQRRRQARGGSHRELNGTTWRAVGSFGR